MKPGSVCRHLKIAGRAIISRFFHVTSQQPRKLQHIQEGRTAPLLVLLPQQHRHSRKDEMPGCIVDDVDLAGIETWLQL